MRSNKSRNVALCATFAVFALALSYVEAVLPISYVVPIPGFKLGLSNIAVMAALFYCGRGASLLVALSKISVTALLFSNVMSFTFSLAGTLLSVSVLIILTCLPKYPFSFFGLSVTSAVCHNVGQIAVAAFWFGKSAVSFFPYLLLVSLGSGIITGALLIAVSSVIDKVNLRNYE